MIIFQVITLSEVGGAQSVVLNLVKKSVEEGHKVYVLSSLGGPLWDLLPEAVFKIPIVSLKRNISIVNELKTLYILKKAYNDYSPDVIHLHSSKAGILGRLIFPKSKIVYTVHGFDSIRVAYRKYLPVEKLLRKRARYIVAVSNYDLLNLRREGIQRNVVCIYNGVEDSAYKDCQIINKSGYVLKPGAFVVMCIARLSPPKRFDLFCQVAEILNKSDIQFVWIGNQFPPLNVLPTNVRCIGEQPNAKEYLRDANLYILLSDYEGLPMSIIEALMYSKPVIASDVGGIREILNGTNGVALPNDVNKIAEKILEYRNNKDIMIDAIKQSRIIYDRDFTITKMYNSYSVLYERIYSSNKSENRID